MVVECTASVAVADVADIFRACTAALVFVAVFDQGHKLHTCPVYLAQAESRS